MRDVSKLLICCLLFGSSAAHSSIESGLLWLKTQQAADGSLALSEATRQHATIEAATAFRALGQTSDPAYANALQYLGSDTTPGMPFVPLRAIATKWSGGQVSTLLTELLHYQNADGGFGSFAGSSSSVIDTVDALEAIAEAGADDPGVVRPALDYLVQGQGVDGGFSYNGVNAPSVYLTARVVKVFQRYVLKYNLSAAHRNAIDFLWHNQVATGWGADWETAGALAALIPATTDASLYAPAVDRLAARQQADGSWSDSTYATALAVQVLKLAASRMPPPDPTTGSISGRLIDGGSGLSIAGARVVVSGSGGETRSGIDGRFEMGGLAPGAYTIGFTHEGYGGTERVVGVVAGQRVDLGTVGLLVGPSMAVLEGNITALASGMPLGGAAVAVSGTGGTQTVVAGSDGGYRLAVPPGPVALVVSAGGYETEAAAGTAIAGQVLHFSPALRGAGTAAGDAQAVRGRLLDGESGTPIPGAQIAAAGVVTASGADGRFLLSDLSATELAIEIGMAGYQTVHLSGVAPAGGFLDLGDLRMPRLNGIGFSSVRGTIIDADSGEAIAGAAVSAGGKSATTDATGRFAIDGIWDLSFTTVVTAAGYFGQSYSIDLAQHAVVNMSFSLRRVAFGGIDIVALTSEKAAYPAYSLAKLTAALRNDAAVERSVRLQLRVFGPTGSQVDDYTILSDLAAGSSLFAVPAGATSEIPASWYDRDFPPGAYKLVLSVHDAASSELLAERSLNVVVEETRRIELARLAASPDHANQNASESVRVLLSVRNYSNVPLALDLAYEWTSPDGTVIRSGAGQVQLQPGTVSTTIQLDEFDHTFHEAGRYRFGIVSIRGAEVGATETGAIDVAPNVRIDPSQSIEPGTIVPQGDTRLRVKIRLEGVQVQ